MISNHNVIITGIPRSGTTLTCHLLNKLPNVVALHEPIRSPEWLPSAEQTIDGLVDDYFAMSRRSLLADKTAISKQHHGHIPDNPKSAHSLLLKTLQRLSFSRSGLEKLNLGGFGLRRSIVEHGRVTFDKPLNADFTLCIKHNGQFTGMLPSLIRRYAVCAIVRNPLAILCSWNSIDFGPRDGHMYATEKINSELATRLAEHPDRYQRQLALLSWFYEQYEQWLKPEQVVRYEDLIRSNGGVLSNFVTQAGCFNEVLVCNNGAYNDRTLSAMLAQRLLESNGKYWQFYTQQSVIDLAARLDQP
jgi:hypothetical protein